jgi:hypothetical protein
MTKYWLTRIRIQLRRKFESDKSFSFSSKDNIHSVAMLLKVSHYYYFEQIDFEVHF